MKEIELHAGHWAATNSGANGVLNEVRENRRFTKRLYEILQAAKVPSTYFEDNASTNQKDNIDRIVAHHNADRNGLIVSIHFNASGAKTDKPIGTEVLYSNQKELAAELSKAISDATGGGLLNRGAKYRDNIGVLTRTYEPAVLIEVAFVNSTIDAAIYNRDFEKICQATAKVLAKAIDHSITKEETKVTTPAPWAKEAIDWAVKNGISDGTRPKDMLTREEAITLLHKFDKYIKGAK